MPGTTSQKVRTPEEVNNELAHLEEYYGHVDDIDIHLYRGAYEIKDIYIVKKNVKVDLFLQMINSGKNLSVGIEDIQYKLTLGDDLKTNGKYEKDVHIEPFSSTTLKFALDFEMLNPRATIVKVWTDQDRVPFRLQLSGYLSVGKMERIPVVLFVSGNTELVNEQKPASEAKIPEPYS